MTDLTKEEFCARFKAHLLAMAGPHTDDAGRAEMEDYADMVGPTYWDEPDQREEGPESCADEDISCWGEG